MSAGNTPFIPSHTTSLNPPQLGEERLHRLQTTRGIISGRCVATRIRATPGLPGDRCGSSGVGASGRGDGGGGVL